MQQYYNQSRALSEIIRVALLEIWDPIGIKTVPECKDEYDSYILPVYGLLIQRKPVEEIVALLSYIQSELMGLRRMTTKSAQRCAESLQIEACKILDAAVE